MRTIADMDDVERQQHARWTAVLNRSTSSEEERKNARIQIDALEYKGNSGPLMKEITELRKRFDAIEKEGQAMSEDDRKALLELRDMAKTFDGRKLGALEQSVTSIASNLEIVAKTVDNHRNDQQHAYSKNAEAIAERAKENDKITKDLDAFIELMNNKFREIEVDIANIKEQYAAVQANLADIVSQALDTTETAVMAEAESAAREAVSNVVGDLPVAEPPAIESDPIEDGGTDVDF